MGGAERLWGNRYRGHTEAFEETRGLKLRAGDNTQSVALPRWDSSPILEELLRRDVDGRSIGRRGSIGRSRWACSLHSPLTTLHYLLFFLLLAPIGCAHPDLQTSYGQRSGPLVYCSVNGTAVLSGMFELSGDTVFSWNVLSPRLYDRVDAIVWFPDDFEPPSEEVRDWLEDWILDSPGRTLVYVGRDFDAEASYWKAVRPLARAKDKKEIQRRENAARIRFRGARRDIPKDRDHAWFTVTGKLDPRRVVTIEGEKEWTEGIDQTKLEIELNGRFAPADGFDVLLESEGDMLIGRQEWWDDSQLIVVSNGSFLLNHSLANHEHRKLAGRLIDAVGPPGQTVGFLESYAGGPAILDHDPAVGPPLGLDMFTIWPTNWILIHFTIAGVIFCFARFPIFGRPLELEVDSRSDFDKHITALGELLARSRDTSYAETRIKQYRQTIAHRLAEHHNHDIGKRLESSERA